MIFTDRTVIVQKGTSSINDTIVLYRGDKNVEVRFTLNEGSPFKFGSGASPNIIEKTEAAYGQLIIKRPNDLPAVFSEIAPTNEGKIVFTITAEMIDEITEVGNYTFQIRLLDESMNSRATLPEVNNGIEIREPIATEDITTTNEVGVATVGYAMTTAGTPEDAFDSQGNYNKTTWGTGDRITATKLNKMEAGIDGVNKKVASGETGSSGASNINDTTASTTTTYSSNKIENIKEGLSSQIKDIANQIDNIGIGSLNLRDIQIGEIFVLKTSTANIPVSAVALNKSTLSLNVGDSETLIPIITPDNATSSNIIWSCSNDNANVEGGTVTALKAGSCVITATSDDTTNGTIKATCNVTCTNVSVQSVSISGDTEISTSSSTTLTANIIPSNATNKEVSWSVNNNNVTLTPDGLTCMVTGVIEGTSSITVTTADGNKTATYDINISKGVTAPDECDILTTNLQGYYKMSNLSSDQSQILDISGNSRNMTIYPANMTIGDGYYTKNNGYNHINNPDYSSHDSGGTQFIDVFGTDITLFVTIDASAVTDKEAIFGLENMKGFGACTFQEGVIIYNNSQTGFNQVQSSTSSCLQGLCTLAFVHNGTTNKDFIYKDGVLLNEQDSKVNLVDGKVADYLGIGRGYANDYGKIKFYNWAVYNNVLDGTAIQSISTTLLNNAGGGN